MTVSRLSVAGSNAIELGVVNSGLEISPPTSIANSGGSASLTGNTVTFSGCSSISLNGCFSGDYDNYRIVTTYVNSTSGENQFRLRDSGSDSASSYTLRIAYFQSVYATGTGTGNEVRLGDSGTERALVTIEIANVFADTTTAIFATGNDGASTSSFINAGVHTATSSYDGFTLISTTSMTGTVSVYGYKS